MFDVEIFMVCIVLLIYQGDFVVFYKIYRLKHFDIGLFSWALNLITVFKINYKST